MTAVEQQLRDRIAELEELIGTGGKMVHVMQDVLRLTPVEAQILGYLMKRNTASREGMFLAVYGGLPERSQPDIKVLDVMVCKLRKVLDRHEVNVRTLWGIGYFMKRDDKQKLKRILEEQRND